jgi:hypothetical protein
MTQESISKCPRRSSEVAERGLGNRGYLAVQSMRMAGGMAQVIEHLSIKHIALSSIPNAEERERRRGREREEGKKKGREGERDERRDGGREEIRKLKI